jgi:hypothetical protein
MTFTTIHTEGAILPADLLLRVANGDRDLDGLTPDAYHLVKGERINEAVSRSWNRLLGAWTGFRSAAEKLPDGDPGTSITRERWLLPLFQELGYGRLVAARAIEIEGKSYPISHIWHASRTPIHLVGCGVDLDKRTAGVAGAARSSPHSLVQELLNRSSETLWGIVSNGLRLRVLRDNASLTRQAYVEFDVQAMFDGEVYADFALLWLVCHQSRVEGERPESCWLEQWSRAAQEQGTRALDQLRDGVESAIRALGSGFLSHAANRALRDKMQSGALSTQDYYRQLLRLVYRLIFLFTAEDRDLLLDPDADPSTLPSVAGQAARERYVRFYSTARLRRLAERRVGTRHADLFHGLGLVMDKLGGDGCPDLGLPALGSFLFSPAATPDLDGSEIANHDLLDAIRALAFTTDRRIRRVVDYKNLGSEEWGGVYTSLLELHPILNMDAGTFELNVAVGNERKTTGSYYTQPALVNELIESALEPVIEDRLKQAKTAAERERTLLSLKVCDFASGSGHMLLAAARRIARHLASVRTGDEEPSPEAMRTALRDAIGHCIYGVDINPMAVELCKVNLWMEALEPGKPLSFLDHHIKCGNSLIGATPALLEKGIPDEAFTPITGDDKAVCTEFKKRNKKERSGQRSLFDGALQPWERLGDLAASMLQLEEAADDTIDDVRHKQEQYEALVKSSGYVYGHLWADAWCAAFVWKKTKEFPYPITEEVFRKIERNPFDIAPWMRDEIRRLAEQYQFFHWHLEFPDVFGVQASAEALENEQSGWSGGFDALLSNPPWERIKLQEEEFFAARDPQIAAAPNKAARQKLISALSKANPALAHDFEEAKREHEAVSLFVRNGDRYPLTAVGDVNTYALFAELARSLIAPMGHASIIVPTGIATDDTTKGFFSDCVSRQSLVKIAGFINEEMLFPGVLHNFKFCLLTLVGTKLRVDRSKFIFYCHSLQHLTQGERHFALSSDDFVLLNPNTRTCPTFRTLADAELTKAIYRRVPVLANEGTGQNLWGVQFLQMFHMANDSALFRSQPGSGLLPLYEGKMIYQYDHRFASYESLDKRMHMLPEVSLAQHQDPEYTVTASYYVHVDEVEQRLARLTEKRWLFGYRIQSSSGLARTMIFSCLPRVAIGEKIPLVIPDAENDAERVACLLANGNCLVFDFVARQKVGGATINLFIIRQLPVLPPSAYASTDIDFIAPRVLELVYTAWDLKPFAEDMGYHGEPFKWDEDRRAHLRAELDAYYARLYSLSRDELRYILDPKDVYGPDFPGETFRVLKEKEEKQFGEYRTRRLVLAAWDRMFVQA